MSDRPTWLPDMLVLDGTWEKTIARLFAVFEQDFIHTKRMLGNREVWWDRRKLDGKYDEGFWHIISEKDRSTQERIPDFPRAERLPWCGPTISNNQDLVVKSWDYREGTGRIRTYLWLEDWDYVVVLEKRPHWIGEIAFLITAFHVRGDSTRRNLNRRFNTRVR